jgi:hypothetical protein
MKHIKLLVRLKWHTLSDKFWLGLARRVPKKLAYWCTIVVGAHATSGKYNTTIVPELSLMEALNRWGK